ncbi:MAG: hypothetical protein Q4C83_02100, partial [Candidatus Saccharibacteria bacterium]|nr:hypothetical protein [Candidatus Saccharibacteria bacterium]
DRTYNNQTINSDATWATHPAFTFGNRELNGIWVGKFETTGRRGTPTVKPNQQAGVGEFIGTNYSTAKNIGVEDADNTGGNTISGGITQNYHNLNSYNSHMLKNSEWGAVTYLSASSYGAGVNNIQPNNATPRISTGGVFKWLLGITGCGPSADGKLGTYSDGTTMGTTTIESPTACSQDISRAYNGSLGQLASTTNNIYGIYDMSGGSAEYVMGNLTSQEDITEPSNNTMMVAARSPYVDLYKVDPNGFGVNSNNPGSKPAWSNSSDFRYSNNDVCTWETCGGQALHETKLAQSTTSYNQSWGDSYTYFSYGNSRWLRRGGYAGSGTGIFATEYDIGGLNDAYGSRAVMISSVQ